MKEFHLLLINSNTRKALESILSQKNNFIKTISGMSSAEQCQWIKDFMIEKNLIVSFNKKLPLLFVLSGDAKAIIAINHKTKKVIDFMIARLLECLFIQYYTYMYYKKEVLVFIFTYDKAKPSAKIKEKMNRQKEDENRMLKLSNNLF